jgi:site-specific recombinase XerD
MIHTLSRALTFFFEDYLLGARGVSPNTVLAYRDAFKRFGEFIRAKKNLESVGQFRITQVTPDLVLDFLDHLEDPKKGLGNSISTRNARLAAIQSFFKALPLLHERYVPLAKQMASVPIKRTRSESPDFLERDELRKVFAAVDRGTDQGLRDLTILLFMYNIGARASEAAQARISWLRFEADPPHVRVVGKGQRARMCPLWDVTAAFLKHYLAAGRPEPATVDCDWLFLGARRRPLTRKGIWGIVRRYVEAARKTCPSLEGKHLTAHSMRHTLGVHLRQAGVDDSIIQSWLGHIRLDTTARYARVRVQDAQKAVEKFFALAEVFPYTAEFDEKKQVLDDSVVDWLESL